LYSHSYRSRRREFNRPPPADCHRKLQRGFDAGGNGAYMERRVRSGGNFRPPRRLRRRHRIARLFGDSLPIRPARANRSISRPTLLNGVVSLSAVTVYRPWTSRHLSMQGTSSFRRESRRRDGAGLFVIGQCASLRDSPSALAPASPDEAQHSESGGASPQGAPNRPWITNWIRS